MLSALILSPKIKSIYYVNGLWIYFQGLFRGVYGMGVIYANKNLLTPNPLGKGLSKFNPETKKPSD